MTNYERELFSDLLSVNMLIDEQENKEVARFLSVAYYRIREQLIESMGEREYNDFIRMGREMFAPAKN